MPFPVDWQLFFSCHFQSERCLKLANWETILVLNLENLKKWNFVPCEVVDESHQKKSNETIQEMKNAASLARSSEEIFFLSIGDKEGRQSWGLSLSSMKLIKLLVNTSGIAVPQNASHWSCTSHSEIQCLQDDSHLSSLCAHLHFSDSLSLSIIQMKAQRNYLAGRG